MPENILYGSSARWINNQKEENTENNKPKKIKIETEINNSLSKGDFSVINFHNMQCKSNKFFHYR